LLNHSEFTNERLPCIWIGYCRQQLFRPLIIVAAVAAVVVVVAVVGIFSE